MMTKPGMTTTPAEQVRPSERAHRRRSRRRWRRRAVAGWMASAREMSSAGLTLGDAFTRLTNRWASGSAANGEPVGTRLSAALTEAEPDFRRALAAIDRAVATRHTIDRTRFVGPLG